jgi:excisionase family DNA binding protein
MDVDLDKEVFTTFEAAKLCNANITSIKNWIEKGELRAFRTPGGHYRIEQKVLDDFLNRHSMPNPFAERERRRVLLVHHDSRQVERVACHFGEQHDYTASDDPQQALLTIGQWRPDAAVVDDRVDGIDLPGLCETIRHTPELSTVSIIAMHNRDEAYSEALRQAGCDYVVSPVDDEAAMMEAIRRSLL